MGKPKNICIVAVDREALTLSYLERAYRKYKLRAYHRIILPGDDGFSWLEDKGYSDEISSFVLRNRLNTETVVLSISAREAITTYLQLPEVAREDAENILRFEVEKHIPIPLENVIYGYRLRTAGRSGGLEVAIAAAEKTTLEGYINLLEEAGISPSIVCLDLEGHIKYWMDRQSAGEKAFLFLRVFSGSVDLCLVEKGLLKYFRSIPWDGESSLAPLVKRELRGVENQLSDFSAGGLSFVGVNGAEEGEGGILDSLQGELRVRVFYEGATADIKVAGRENMEPRGQLAAEGLAAAVAEDGDLMNMLPERARVVKRARSPVNSLRVLLILAFLSLGFMFGRAYSERWRLKAVEMELEGIREQVLQVEELESQVEGYLNKLSIFEELRLKEPSKLELLRELTVVLPPTGWLSVLIYENGKLDVSGYAESASGLIPLLEESDYFMNAQFIAPIIQRPWGEEFKIRVSVER